jgi:oxygen-independent coproporphyrinogen III oxidase
MKNQIQLPLELLKKYNLPGPRYTSYPTYPAWKGLTANEWFSHFQNSLKDNPSLSLYIHVPFCRTLCAFCGCTKMITKDYGKADEYIEALHKEFAFYEKHIPENTKIFEIHLGGGSPSWLKPAELERLLKPILNSKKFIIDRSIVEQSIEMDPRTTTTEHCENLARLGFNRVSLGIQDTNDQVLKSIRRDQPLSLVTRVVNDLKANGIELFNMDLIYGLPFQTSETIKQTINDILVFRPTRLALYSYAHVPSLKPAQKLLEKDGLPNAEEKMLIAEIAREMLVKAGYIEIGMDHFALPSDSLYNSFKKNELHRNFMGYTVQRSNVLLGLGPSSLSDSWTAFSQNEKEYPQWRENIMANGHSIVHGHTLNEKELKRRKEILNLMCEFKTNLNEDDISPTQKLKMQSLIDDKLLEKNGSEFKATENGKHFIRNICMALDDALENKNNNTEYSKTV